ncbi:MAG: M28 family peptidase [Acidobacteria bacterium]|nr:M28 family peptidase [Acidobacteriota bacterium]
MGRRAGRAWGWLVLAASLCGCAALAEGGQSQAQATTAAPALPALTEAAVDEARRLVRPSNDERVDVLLEMLEQRGLPYAVEPFPGIGAEDDPRAEGRNVVVSFGDGTPEVIVGAHIDSRRLPSGELSDAMVDDGAGVVVLLHVADALRNVPLDRRVRIVFFDMEEIGLVGSRAFVAALDPAEVAAMINVDVVGYGDTLLYGPQATSPDGSPAHLLQQACARRGMPCVGMPGMPPGDDRSFLQAGIPAVSLAVVTAEEVHRLWLFLHGDLPDDLRGSLAPEALRIIHTERDTAELLEPAAMTRAFHTVTDVVLDLAAAP